MYHSNTRTCVLKSSTALLRVTASSTEVCSTNVFAQSRNSASDTNHFSASVCNFNLAKFRVTSYDNIQLDCMCVLSLTSMLFVTDLSVVGRSSNPNVMLIRSTEQ